MPKITEAELKKQIKKQKSFSPVYVLYGTEQMFVKRCTEMLVEAVAGKHPSEFNFHAFKGDINLDEFAASMCIVPFMSEYNCVLVTDIFFDSMDADELSRLKDICASTCEGTVLIISMPSYIPKKNKAAFSSIIKKAEKQGIVCEFKKQTQATVERYVAKWANENGKLISQINASKLISSCGGDLNLLKNEVNKIANYSKGEEITYEDIEKLASVNLESRIFDLSDAVLGGNGDKAFQILNRLFYQKEEPVMMLYVLSAAFTDAYRIRVADECGVTQDKVAADFEYKNRAFVLKNARRSTAKVSTEALRECLNLLSETDYRFKSASVNYRLALEQLIASLLITADRGRKR